MRRHAVAFGLVAVGAFLLTTAAMLRWYAEPLAAQVPLDPDLTVTLAGTGLAYDVALGAPVSGPVTERLLIRGGAGRPDVAVWAVDRRLAAADGTPLRLDTEQVALDRRTAAAVGCCGEHPAHAGLTYLFPPGVRRADQSLYDPATGRAAPARYAGAEVVAGQRAYRFEQIVPDTDLGARSVPGAPRPAARAAPGRLFAASRRTLWVEPGSGVVLRVVEQRRERLVRLAGPPLTLLDVRLRTDAASEARLAGLAADRRALLAALRTIAPAALAAVGGVLLLAGVGYRIVIPRTRKPRAEMEPSS